VTTAKLAASFGGLKEVLSLVWTNAGRVVKLRIITVLALVVSASVLTALGPVALKLIVDRFTHTIKSATVLPLALIGLYVLSQWAARIVGQIWSLFYARAERRMFRTLSERLFSHLMRLPLRFHLDRQTGAISQTFDNGLQGYQILVHHLVFTFLPVTAELGTIIVVLSRLVQPAFMGLFCGALVFYAAAFAYAAASISKAAEAASAAHVDATAVMTDGILNYETVKYFTAESILQEKVSAALKRTEVEWVNFFRLYAFRGLVVATIFAVFLGATVLYASDEVAAGRMSVGDFVLVNTYMLQVVRPIEMLGYAMQGLSQGIAMLEKMLLLFREMPEPQLVDSPVLFAGAGKLEFENVTLSYQRERQVLTGVSFGIAAGKTLGIVGASGSGKSSIVRLLVRLLEPDNGRILLDDVPIAELTLSGLRQAIAVVPQDTVLFNDTIGYNIGIGKPQSTPEEIERAAKLAHLHEFIMNLPETYNTKVGERGVKLSGGEKQRVSIARAAIKHPRIYVFDEATSSLDSRTERQILRNLKEISRFSTTLVIAHRLSTVAHADEILVLERGVVVEQGTHSSLLCRNGKYAMLWETQHAGPGAAA
jgi:ABC-type transport system involved in Fe-S cluster assembly fused permease/ATPase subunit